MKALVQRVSEASVTVGDRVVGSIGRGLLVLLGVEHGDGEREAALLARKVANLRIFEDEAGKMNRSVLESGGGVLAVSQFTLCADVRKGNRPSFIGAAPPELANPLYARFCDAGRRTGRAGRARRVRRAHGGPAGQRRPGDHLARHGDLAGRPLSRGCRRSRAADHPRASRIVRTLQRVGSGATRTSSLPKFSPSSRPMKAAGAFSSPSRMSSR